MTTGLWLVVDNLPELAVEVLLDGEPLGVLNLSSLDQFLRLRQILSDDCDPSEHGAMTSAEWRDLEEAVV